jgi:hypothetical protein
MAFYIVNVFKKEVHINDRTVMKCNITRMRDNHRVDTDLDYTDGYNAFKPCPHCFGE